MKAMTGRAVHLEVDIVAIQENALSVRAALTPGTRLFACLKGDAYGCSIALVAPALAAIGVHSFAVGAIEDAVAIRAAGIDGEILLYPNCLPDSHALVARHRLTVTLSSEEEARAWDAVAAPGTLAFAKIDVGALRAGALPGAMTGLGRVLRSLTRIRIVGAYAHLNLAKPAEMNTSARWQFEGFRLAVANLREQGLDLDTLMVSGTAALLQFPEMDLDAVDPGRVLFGLGFPDTLRQLSLRSALYRWSCRLLLVKDVLPQDADPYNSPFPVREPVRIGLVPIGWSDGLPRHPPPALRVLVGGLRVPLIGPVHFEHVRIDLTGVPAARFGDEVVLLGPQGDEQITLPELAGWCGRDELHFLGTLPRHLARRPSPSSI
jgi:alanine racemase